MKGTSHGGRARLALLVATTAIAVSVSSGCGPGTDAGGGADEAAAAPSGPGAAQPVAGPPLRLAGEARFGRVRQLTDGGENAEAYWDGAAKRLIFQSTRDDLGCDQIFTMDPTGGDLTQVSTGLGRTTCGYYFPDGKRIVYSSTHLDDELCPPKPDYSAGYVWPLYPGYEIFTARADGSELERLTHSPGYDAEATVSPDGSRILFTSMRDGDPEIYSMAADGSDVRRLTHTPGYDGGAFYSFDGSKIVFRANRPGGEELADFRRLLGMNLIRPSRLEVFVMDADGGNVRQVTRLGGANFCPFWHPDGRRIIFSSNHENPRGRNFDLFLISEDGTGLEKVTTSETFDGFPMFDREGRRLVFSSNRNSRLPGETNVFVAEWIE